MRASLDKKHKAGTRPALCVKSGVFQKRRCWLRTLNRAVQVGEGGAERQAFRIMADMRTARIAPAPGGCIKAQGD